MFAPAASRAALFALHALNLELAHVRSSTSDGSIGRMRFTWWRTTIAQALRGEPPDHPVAQALARAHEARPLTGRYLEQMVDAREADLSVRQPENVAEVATYCERTAGALLLLGLECVGAPPSEAAEHAAVHVGCALGLATLLRGAPVHAAQGCTYVPADVAARHAVSLKGVLDGQASQALADANFELANEATTHLLAARSLRAELPPAARAVLLPCVVADLVLQRLHRCAYATFAPEVRQPLGVRLPLSLAWRSHVLRAY